MGWSPDSSHFQLYTNHLELIAKWAHAHAYTHTLLSGPYSSGRGKISQDGAQKWYFEPYARPDHFILECGVKIVPPSQSLAGCVGSKFTQAHFTHSRILFWVPHLVCFVNPTNVNFEEHCRPGTNITRPLEIICFYVLGEQFYT